MVSGLGLGQAQRALRRHRRPSARARLLWRKGSSIPPYRQVGCRRHDLHPGLLPSPGLRRLEGESDDRPQAHEKRFLSFDTYAERDAPGAMTLPEEFKRNGYHCLSNGKVFHHKDDTAKRSWSEAPLETEFGRSLLYRSEVRVNDWRTKEARSRLGSARGRRQRIPGRSDCRQDDCRSQADEKKGRPFFLACGFKKPHLPFYAPKNTGICTTGPPSNLPTTANARRTPLRRSGGSGEIHNYHDRGMKYNGEEWHRACLHGYYACVSYVDAQIGKIMKTLDDLDLRENTIIVLWGDHGWHLGEHNFWGKHNLMHLSTRSPLIISAPGFKPGQTCDRLVEFVDLYPTLMDLSGLKSFNQGLEGTSFTPLLENPRLPWKKAVFSQFKSALGVLTDRYNYAEFDDGSKMLFDLKADPDE